MQTSIPKKCQQLVPFTPLEHYAFIEKRWWDSPPKDNLSNGVKIITDWDLLYIVPRATPVKD